MLVRGGFIRAESGWVNLRTVEAIEIIEVVSGSFGIYAFTDRTRYCISKGYQTHELARDELDDRMVNGI